MTKDNITRYIAPCIKCGEPTPYADGFCETCDPDEQVEKHPFQPAYKEFHDPEGRVP